jgi:hypothetical protein
MRTFTLCCIAVLGVAVDAAAGTVSISEVFYDASGADDGKVFVELFGEDGFDLDGFSLAAINGSDGKTYLSIDLSGHRIPPDGFFVVADGIGGGSTSVSNADLIVANIDLQNGPDSLRLLSAGTVIDALGYGTVGSSGTFAGEGDPAPDPSAGSSVARVFADVDTDDNSKDFRTLSTPTPGTGKLDVHSVPLPDGLGLGGLGLTLVLLAGLRRRYSWKQ